LCPARERQHRPSPHQQRLGAFYSDLRHLDAYDVIVRFPHVTQAEPGSAALARTRDVQQGVLPLLAAKTPTPGGSVKLTV
jgi:hypothetical protein